jgi:DNA-binding NarL/FixJ family response regulator
MSPIRVLLADDHALFRKGVADLLSGEDDFELVGEADDGAKAVEMAREMMPDVILMDISMPGMDGLEATRRIKAEIPYVRIVILTVSESENTLFDAIKSGAQGYLLKNVQPQSLLETLNGVVRGEASISGAMAARLLHDLAREPRPTAPPPRPPRLTQREQEVLGLVAQGKSNKEIASSLSIAENTVKNHLKNILEKLHLENRVQAAAFALRQELGAGTNPGRR